MDKCNCFIRFSTKELTDFIYMLGDRKGDGFWHSLNKTLLIVEPSRFICLDDEWGNDIHFISKGYVDCGMNEDLFKALSMIGTKNYWVTDGTQWYLKNDNPFKTTTFRAANSLIRK